MPKKEFLAELGLEIETLGKLNLLLLIRDLLAL